MDPDHPALDQYIIEQTGKANPKICFLATASGESNRYIVKFYAGFTALGCRPTHLSLFRPSTADLASVIMAQDVIYVGGGNTKSMLALWRAWGLDEILHEAWYKGVVMAGLSAGAICWFEQGVTDSIPDQLNALSCLGFLSGSCCPHYDGQPERRPAYHRLMREDKILPGYGIDDSAALHFIGDELKCLVSARPEAKAYRVAKISGEIQEETIAPCCRLSEASSADIPSSNVSSAEASSTEASSCASEKQADGR